MSKLNVGAIDYTSGVAIKSQAVNTQTGTTYTFVESDAGKLVSASNASAVTFTIPPQSSVTWGSNAVVKVVNYGAGVLTVAGGAGVTVTNTAKTLAQFESAALIRTGSDAWTLAPFSGGVKAPTSVEYLVIAGGGGGGNFVTAVSNGGGGGAGGYRNSVSGETSGRGSTAETPIAASPNVTYTVTVGAGGAANVQGSSSSISGTGITTITSTGGGRGTGSGNGGAGGAGGGGAHPSGTGGAGTTGQGFNGGNAPGSNFAGGGGGGTGGNASGLNGGNGLASIISGSSITRGGGGGGGASSGVPGAGGTGGGGTAGTSAGGTNTGGGGGGGSAGGGGFAGGSGVVFMRQARSDSNLVATVTGGSITVNATHIIYSFTGSGTINWVVA